MWNNDLFLSYVQMLFLSALVYPPAMYFQAREDGETRLSALIMALQMLVMVPILLPAGIISLIYSVYLVLVKAAIFVSSKIVFVVALVYFYTKRLLGLL